MLGLCVTPSRLLAPPHQVMVEGWHPHQAARWQSVIERYSSALDACSRLHAEAEAGKTPDGQREWESRTEGGMRSGREGEEGLEGELRREVEREGEREGWGESGRDGVPGSRRRGRMPWAGGLAPEKVAAFSQAVLGALGREREQVQSWPHRRRPGETSRGRPLTSNAQSEGVVPLVFSAGRLRLRGDVTSRFRGQGLRLKLTMVPAELGLPVLRTASIECSSPQLEMGFRGAINLQRGGEAWSRPPLPRYKPSEASSHTQKLPTCPTLLPPLAMRNTLTPC